MKYKNVMIAFAVVLLAVLFIRQVAHDYENYDFKLEGTYTDNKQTFDWFSFGNDGPNTFRLYYMDGGSQKEDRGTFAKRSDREYVLSSPYLGKIKVVCFKKFPNKVGFTLFVGESKSEYIQTSTSPAQLESSTGGN